jgi:ABC-type iron transport system FetAB ATPase subunit
MVESVSAIKQPVLRLSGFAVAAAGRRLLTDIDLELVGGELVALDGPSGCGKTTLLRAIVGLIDPDAGEVQLHGDCPGDLQWPCYRRRTILVAQRPTLLAGSVRENLTHPFRYRSVGTEFPAAKAADLLARIGLAPERLDQEARSLSQGEQQRVGLVRALLLEPAVLLLDEPTSALDEEAAAATEEIVSADARERGLAALIVTHLRQQAARWCQRTVDLRSYMTTTGPTKLATATPSPHAPTPDRREP